MISPLKNYTADHRFLLDQVRRHAGLADPIAVQLDDFEAPLLKAARKGLLLPIDGVLVRDWDPDCRRSEPGINLGMRLYEIERIPFVAVRMGYHNYKNCCGLNFVAVDRSRYRDLYRVALRCRRYGEQPGRPPVLPACQVEQLWQNTVGFLENANLNRIKAYGGRARRGLLLMGSPGNGKTMACRWLWEECARRNWEWRMVTPDAYRRARMEQSIAELFSVDRRGIIFFDDMDLALRDRETVHETEDQSVFLSALDGITINEGVVFVFTSNCAPELIDRAFKRPGRLDLVIHFKAPDADMRSRLVERWHPDIRRAIAGATIVASTEGHSFAEIEELKNLLIMHHFDTDRWDWAWAMEQFAINRQELRQRKERRVGFSAADLLATGNGNSALASRLED